MKKIHLKEDAKKLYINELKTFSYIAKKLKVSDRTLRIWAKKENWENLKKEFLQKAEGLLSDRIEIASMLGKKIKDALKKGKEPSTATLNAYRGITEGLYKVKQFEDSEKKNDEPTGNLSEQTKHTIKKLF